jgi:hypothetical protein
MVAYPKGYQAPFSSQLAHLVSPSRCSPNMPSDVEMGDCDSSPFDGQIDLNPAIASSVTAGPERVTHNCKDYVRRAAIYAVEAPSVIWRLGEECERRGQRFWRCGIAG